MLKPLWLSVSYLPDHFISTIVLLGNPAVWWVGFTCLIGISFFVSVKILKNGDKRLANIGLPKMFILILFFFQWFPYMLISRITFIYHFYVNVPFLFLASAYFISKNWSSKWIKVATIAYIVITIVMFGLFYPVISGMPASDSWIHNLKWFESWVF